MHTEHAPQYVTVTLPDGTEFRTTQYTLSYEGLPTAPFPSDGKSLAFNGWLALGKRDVPALVVEYIAEIVTAPTNKYCTCEWIIHPDDIELPAGVKRRMRKGQTSWDCWIHTKEGLVLGFFTWVFTARKNEPDPDETLEVLPEVRERMRQLTEAIEAGEPYEVVMATAQELSRPADAEQRREWDEDAAKQQAVASLLKEQLLHIVRPSTEKLVDRYTPASYWAMNSTDASTHNKPDWSDPKANPLEDIKEFVKKNTPKTILNIKCTCPAKCPLHTGKLIEEEQNAFIRNSTDLSFEEFKAEWFKRYGNKPMSFNQNELGAQIMIHDKLEHVYRECHNPWECEVHKGFVDAPDND